MRRGGEVIQVPDLHLTAAQWGFDRHHHENDGDLYHDDKGIGDAGSTADLRMLWSAIVCLGLGLLLMQST